MRKVLSSLLMFFIILFVFGACTQTDGDEDSTDGATTIDVSEVLSEDNMPQVNFDSLELLAGFCNAIKNIDDDDEIWSWAMEDHAGEMYVNGIDSDKYKEWLAFLEEKNTPIFVCEDGRFESGSIFVALDHCDSSKTDKITLYYGLSGAENNRIQLTVYFEDRSEDVTYDAIETIGDIEVKCVYDEKGDYQWLYTDTATVYVKKEPETLSISNSLRLILFNNLIEELSPKGEDTSEDSLELIQ